MNNLLSRQPSWVIVVFALTLGLYAGWTVNGYRLGERIAEIELDHSAALKEAADRTNALERRWRGARDYELERALERSNELEIVINAERGTSSRLREQLKDYVSRARDSTLASSSPGESGSDPIGVLARVLSGADDTASNLAGYADRLYLAGLSCEALYDSLVGER